MRTNLSSGFETSETYRQGRDSVRVDHTAQARSCTFISKFLLGLFVLITLLQHAYAAIGITIASNPPGQVFTVSGSNCAPGAYTTPQTLQWASGASCTVTFVSPYSMQQGTQYVMTGWQDGGTGNPRTIVVPAQAATYTATFKTQFLASVLANPPQGGTVTGGGWVDGSGTATLTATAAAGYRFVNWLGPNGATSVNPTFIQVSYPQTFTANFTPVTNAAPGNWTVMQIATNASAYGMNSYGQVAGQSANRAFLWNPVAANSTAGSLTDLSASSPTPSSSGAIALNDRGQVLLTTAACCYFPVPVALWTPTVPQGLSGLTATIPADTSGQIGIQQPALNNFGQVATYVNGSPAIWTPNVANGTTGVVTPNAQFQGLKAMNSFGQAIMNATPPLVFTPGVHNGFTGTFTAISGLAGANQSVLAAINDNGVVVGYSCVAQSPSGCQTTGFIWTPTSANGTSGNTVQMPLPAGFTAVTPTAINGSGNIVGTMTPSSGSAVPFLYVAGTYYDLTTISGVPVGATPVAINQAGEIVLNASSYSGTVYLAAPTTPPPPPPATTVTLMPTSGTGSTQSFTFTFPDSAGYQDIAGAQIVINSTLTAVNSCYILFARPDVISLAGDTGVTFQSTSLGAPAVLQNSQCVVLASLTSQSGTGNTVTLTVDVVFKAAFAGPKTVWANYNNIAGVAPGYQQLGTFTATPPPSGFTTAVSPASGSGQAHAFTFSYFDPNGAPDISGAQIVFNSSLTGTNACYILFAASNIVSLASDNATTFSTAVLGKQSVLQNSQCTIFPGLSYQTQSGQTLNVTIFVAFNSSFTGTKNIYSNVNNNAGARTGFSALGVWNVTGPPPVSVNSVNPPSATGPSQALTFVYADPSGASDIISTQVLIDVSSIPLANACLINFYPAAGATGSITLVGSGSAFLGQATTLQNSQCVVNAAASTQVVAGNYLTLTLFVTMKSSGNVNTYSAVIGKTGQTAMAQVGTWNVTSPAAMVPVSVTPLTGSGPAGSSQYLTFTLSDPAGATDISGALIVLYPSLQGVGACYILWGQNSNLLSLASDSATTFASGTLGSTGLLSNSQCTVDPSQSFSVQTGNTVNLTVAVSFNAVFKQYSQIYSWVNVQDQAGKLSGWFLESRFTVE